MTSFTAAQVKEVKSLLKDRQQCATVGGLAHEMNLSRSAASLLLQTVANEDSNTEFQATICRSQQLEEIHGEEVIACAGKCLNGCQRRDLEPLWKCVRTFSLW